MKTKTILELYFKSRCTFFSFLFLVLFICSFDDTWNCWQWQERQETWLKNITLQRSAWEREIRRLLVSNNNSRTQLLSYWISFYNFSFDGESSWILSQQKFTLWSIECCTRPKHKRDNRNSLVWLQKGKWRKSIRHQRSYWNNQCNKRKQNCNCYFHFKKEKKNFAIR